MSLELMVKDQKSELFLAQVTLTYAVQLPYTNILSTSYSIHWSTLPDPTCVTQEKKTLLLIVKYFINFLHVFLKQFLSTIHMNKH